MKFSVPVGVLSEGLSVPFMDWPRRDVVMAILANLKFDVSGGKVVVSTTDTDGWRIGTFALGEEYAGLVDSFTIPFHELREILSVVESDDVLTFENLGGVVRITFDSCEYSLPTLPAEDFPVRKPSAVEATVVVNSSELVRALKRMMFSVATKKCADYRKNTVSFLIDDDMLWLRGGKPIIMSNVPLPYVEWTGEKRGPWNVPYAVCNMLVKAALPEEVCFRFSEQSVCVDLPGGEVEALLNNPNTWRDMKSLLPEKEEHSLEMNVGTLLQFVRRANVTAKDSSSTLVFECDGEGSAVVFSSTQGTGQFNSRFPVDHRKKMKVAFNSREVLGLLEHAFDASDKFRLVYSKSSGMKGSPRVLVFRPSDKNEKYWYIVAPIHLVETSVPSTGADGDDDNVMSNVIPEKRRGHNS